MDSHPFLTWLEEDIECHNHHDGEGDYLLMKMLNVDASADNKFGNVTTAPRFSPQQS